MPTDLLRVTMLENTSTDILQLGITILFSNGSLVMLPSGPICHFAGRVNADFPRQMFNTGSAGAQLSGNMRTVESDLWVRCPADVLTGTLKVTHPLPVDVNLFSFGGQRKVTLPAGLIQIEYALRVADYSPATSVMAGSLNKLNLPSAS